MAVDRVLVDPADDRQSPRHDNLALRWESLACLGEGRILARGSEALDLYQSDLADGFRDAVGGLMSLGRIHEDGRFVPLIRRTIPTLVSAASAALLPELLSAEAAGASDVAVDH